MSANPSNFPIEPVSEEPQAQQPPAQKPPVQTPQPPPAPAASSLDLEADDSPRLGFWERMRRKKRRFIGKMVANMVGENPPPHPHDADANGSSPSSSGSIRTDIEESGLWSGIANRIRRTADEYLHEKLDEIEHRIDKKLEEIDTRLSEWRDKEIANRLRILKITLWASVIVAIISLIYAWLKVYFLSPHG